MNTKVEEMSSIRPQSSLLPMIIIGALFFIFGFVTWLNGALIPFLQMVCQLTETQALMVAFSFYVAYVVMAMPMAWVLERIGYRNGMVFGLLLIAVGAFMFIPAANTRLFAIFLLAQFVMGAGLTILQTASNPYIVKIGPQESAAARIAVMGLLNKAAGVLAPLLFTALVLGEFANVTSASLASLSEIERSLQIEQLANGLITPYIGMAVALCFLSVALRLSGLPELAKEDEKTQSSDMSEKHSILAYPHLILGSLALFFYVGAEVIAGDTIGLYGSKLGISNATSLTSLTMIGMVFGYILGLVLIPRFISQQKALMASALFGLILTLCILFTDVNSTAMSWLWFWTGYHDLPDILTFVALLGLANAMVWPAIWPLALADLGAMTARGSAVLIMGISGGAILPLVYGTIAEESSSQNAYALLFPCYAFILFYALSGCKKRRWKS
ncbi:MAG: sugar MFS transporter [Aestuariibacter sp.]